MPKTITYDPVIRLEIKVDAAGNPTRGRLVFQASNGAHEEASIGGANSGADILFNSLGTAGDRTGFRNVVAAAVAAGKTRIGDV